MTQKRAAVQQAKEALLSQGEIEACQAAVSKQSGLNRQRAVALLALSSGMTQLKAAEASELTIGQVRYLLTVFRRKGMAIFPTAKEQSPSSQLAEGGALDELATEPAEKETAVPPVKKEKKKAANKKDKGKKQGASKDQGKKAKDKKSKEKTKKKKNKDKKGK